MKAPKHDREGNCLNPRAKDCPSYCGMGRDCDVCHKHDQPRMECSECPRCPACDERRP